MPLRYGTIMDGLTAGPVFFHLSVHRLMGKHKPPGGHMGIRKRIADALELQHDVVLNLPMMHITGSERMLMENHKGLLEYGRNKIRVATTAGPVEIEGEDLAIRSVGKDDLLVTGRIRSVTMGKG